MVLVGVCGITLPRRDGIRDNEGDNRSAELKTEERGGRGTARQQFLANRYRRRSAAPRERNSEKRLERHREAREPFMAIAAGLGRLPEAGGRGRGGAVVGLVGCTHRGSSPGRGVPVPD